MEATKTNLNYGFYEGKLPEGWRVAELEPLQLIVKGEQMQDIIKQLADSFLLIQQTEKVISKISVVMPGLFDGNGATFSISSLPGIISKLQGDKTMSEDCKALGALLLKFKKEYDLEGLSKKYNQVVTGK